MTSWAKSKFVDPNSTSSLMGRGGGSLMTESSWVYIVLARTGKLAQTGLVSMEQNRMIWKNLGKQTNNLRKIQEEEE